MAACAWRARRGAWLCSSPALPPGSLTPKTLCEGHLPRCDQDTPFWFALYMCAVPCSAAGDVEVAALQQLCCCRTAAKAY